MPEHERAGSGGGPDHGGPRRSGGPRRGGRGRGLRDRRLDPVPGAHERAHVPRRRVRPRRPGGVAVGLGALLRGPGAGARRAGR